MTALATLRLGTRGQQFILHGCQFDLLLLIKVQTLGDFSRHPGTGIR